jgi:hypothetical protein
MGWTTTWDRLVSSAVEEYFGGRSTGGWIRAKTQGMLGLDERSLAVYRIGLGLLLSADLINRLCDLRAHYTDLGILPRASLAMGAIPSVHFPRV